MYIILFYYYPTGPSMCTVVFFVWAIIDNLIPIIFLTSIIVLLALCIKERKKVGSY